MKESSIPSRILSELVAGQFRQVARYEEVWYTEHKQDPLEKSGVEPLLQPTHSTRVGSDFIAGERLQRAVL